MSNRLFIVLRPEGKVLQTAREIQELINQEYQIYPAGQLPLIHITLAEVTGQINKKTINGLEEMLADIASQNSPVKLILDGFHCFSISSKAIVLKLIKSEELIQLTEAIYQRLSQFKHLEFKYEPDNIQFHITLASSFFASNPLSDLDHKYLCTFLEAKKLTITSKTRQMELWQPYLEPEKAIIKRFTLSE